MGTRKKTKAKSSKPQDTLCQLIDEALGTAKTARKHRQSLNGANHYANKMANLRADATNIFEEIPDQDVGNAAAMAELMQKIFSADTDSKERNATARDLKYLIKTTWKEVRPNTKSFEDGGIFPLVTLNDTGRGYLAAIGRQMNGCYASGWYDSCAVMMRRLLESSIIEAFEGNQIANKIKNANGDFIQLTDLCNAALAEPTWNLPRNVKNNLSDLKNLGHRSAHNRYYLAKKPDIDKHSDSYREAIEAFLHLSKLLK